MVGETCHESNSCNQCQRTHLFLSEKAEESFKTLKITTPHNVSIPHLKFSLNFMGFHPLSVWSCKIVAFDVVRVLISSVSWKKSMHCSLLLTVDDHIDIFDIRRGNIIAGLAFITTSLVPHDAYDVQVLFSIQRLCCRHAQKWVKGVTKAGKHPKNKRTKYKMYSWLCFSMFPTTLKSRKSSRSWKNKPTLTLVYKFQKL